MKKELFSNEITILRDTFRRLLDEGLQQILLS